MPLNESFTTLAGDFLTLVHSQVWCSATTVDIAQRPRSRVLHPVWENNTDHTVGWIATGRNSLKAKHLAQHPYMSLCYMHNPLKPVYIDCETAWVDDPTEKARIWALFRDTPPPLGYDLAGFFGSVDNPGYGVLKLTPTRIELADLFGQPRVWRAS